MFSNKKYSFTFYLLFAIGVSVIFLQIPDSCVFPGVDGSFRFAFNAFISYPSKILETLYYPCGPLLFLRYPISFGDHILIANYFELLIRLLLCLYIYQLVSLLVNKQKLFWLILTALFCNYFLYFDFIIYAIVLYAGLAYILSNKFMFFIPGLCIIAISLFIKTGIFLPVLSIISLVLFYLVINKNWRGVLFIISFLIFLSLVIVYAIGYNVSYLFTHFYRELQLSLTFQSEANVVANNNMLLLLVSVCLLFCLLFLKKSKTSNIAFFISSLFVFLIWKYSIGRQDEGHIYAWVRMLYLLFPIYLMTSNNKIWTGLILFFSFCLYNLNIYNIYGKPLDIFRSAPTFKNFNLLLLHPKENKAERMQVSRTETNKFILPDSISTLIGKSTIDCYPYELSYAFANNMQLHPRPCLQINAFGVQGDRLDSIHFSGSRAPAYILWHSSYNGFCNLDGLDSKLLQHDNYASMQSIIKTYSLIYYNLDNYYLFKKRETAVKEIIIGAQSVSIYRNKWHSVGKLSKNYNTLLRANWNTSIWSRILAFLYKAPNYQIAIKMQNGQEHIFNLSISALQKGILINKIILNPLLEHRDVIAFKIIDSSSFTNVQPINAQLISTKLVSN